MPETYTPALSETGTWTEEEIRQQPNCWIRSLSNIEKIRADIDGFLAPLLAKEDLRLGDFLDLEADPQHLVEPRRFQVFEIDAAHDEGNPRVAQQVGLVVADRAQPFAATAFEKLEVVGVIDDAASVGVFVVNANGERESVRLLFVFHGSAILSQPDGRCCKCL